ncbi:HepT-like ribonuclease domain-containing protein [Hymenobacter weizhouensis]|uniref:HepT-like ribonuclease domain-containing protein n=1 Tax=Hymenobacter sp. YIM 151500-1 TaxID=2987689 RepID=UPI002226D80C|nr:HepT-like ribonuclease domain-containing protein [Hymenobacter sp. YIM 151500-1]UYZ62235.1 DUF86 domain-containing protein [Hymenobacter sp. YIM 151500-1]
MSLPPLERLLHIQQETAYLQRCRTAYPLGEIVHDENLSRAVVRSLEIIGEAVKSLPADWRDRYPAVPWRQIARMRDRLIHHYFDVDFEVVGNVLESEIDPLAETVATMLR